MSNIKESNSSLTVYEDEKIFSILEKVLSAGSVSVIDKSNNVVGSLNKETVSRFINN